MFGSPRVRTGEDADLYLQLSTAFCILRMESLYADSLQCLPELAQKLYANVC